MRKRPVHLFALGTLAAALAFITHTTAKQPAPAALAAQPAKEPSPGIKVAPSRVTAVTVYPTGALVTREVEATGPAGRVEIVVSPLPPATVNTSLYAEGTEGVRVLTTRYRTRPILEDTRADVQKLRDEHKQLQLAREKIEGDLNAIQENVKMLAKMEGFLTVTTVQATEKGALNAEAAIALAKHIREQRTENAKEVVALKQQVQANTEKSEAAQRRLSELASGIARYEHDAIIVVDKANALPVMIKLNYLVEKASWHPQYKLRADKAGKEQVTLEYLAAVVQSTGEEWPNVKLSLSTAQPMLNSAPPDLQTLHVSVAPKGAAAARAAVDRGTGRPDQEPALEGAEGLERPQADERRGAGEHRGGARAVVGAVQPGSGRQARLHAQLPRRPDRDVPHRRGARRCRRAPTSRCSKSRASISNRTCTTRRCRSSRRTSTAWPTW